MRKECLAFKSQLDISFAGRDVVDDLTVESNLTGSRFDSPATMGRVVVFPQTDSPGCVTNSPSPIATITPSTATEEPYFLEFSTVAPQAEPSPKSMRGGYVSPGR